MPNPETKLMCFVACLIFLSCNSNPNNLNNPSTGLKKDSPGNASDTSEMAVAASKKSDTVYKSFFCEDTLKHGYYFGMTLSEWNKHLALLAKSGVVNELSENDIGIGQYIARGSYKAFQSYDDSKGYNKKRNGYYLTGLFSQPSYRVDTIEIFKRYGKIVTDPVLIGLELDFDVPYDDFKEIINIIVEKDQLKYLAGPDPQLPTNKPLSSEDFSNPMQEGLNKFANRDGPPVGKVESISKDESTQTLFENNNFYTVIEVKETDVGSVTRNSDYTIESLKNATRYFYLTQRVFSKKQAALKISDYMTEVQRTNYNNSSETKKLIDKALK